MSPRISVIGPVLNEADFIGYSIMACLPYVHEFIYALDANSNDGTRELLAYIKGRHAHEKLRVIETPNFHPSDTPKYNAAFNVCIEAMTGDAAWFLHPDMIPTNPEAIGTIPEHSTAWFVRITSFAKDFQTVFVKGRTDRWKNIHRKQFGLHYWGPYGSAEEDFYHREITGNAHKFHSTEFNRYPFGVMDSGVHVNHYCEMKPYSRRLEKMEHCLRNQNPKASEQWIRDNAPNHPRVTLESGPSLWGRFETAETVEPPPPVFAKYRDEFEPFKLKPIGVANG